MIRILPFALAAVLSTAGGALAYDWTAPDADQPNVPTVGEAAHMPAAPASRGFSIKKPVGSIYDMTDQNGSIDGKPDFEGD